LKTYNIVNEFAECLDFPKTLMRGRRDHDRFFDLIEAVCFLRQYQKKIEYDDDYCFIRCDLEDYKIAYKIMITGVLSSTMGELSEAAYILYDSIRNFVRKESVKEDLEPTKISFTQRQIREATGQAHMLVKNNMRKLAEFEYLEIAKGGGARTKTHYRLMADDEIKKIDLSMIPTPDEIEKKFYKTGSSG
jgi:hypothetical protein